MSRHFSKTLFLARQCEQHHLRACAQIQITSSLLNDIRPSLSNQQRLPLDQVHPFSTSQRWRAQPTTKSGASSGKKPSDRMAKMMEEAKRSGMVPEDVGLLPDTFVMPFGKNLPSWISNLRNRLFIERKRLKTRFTEWGATLVYRYWTVRPRPRLRLRQIPSVAESLHKQMYEHFAAGDVQPMENQICTGMMSSLRGRIAQRPVGTQMKWKLHKYLSPSKLVSFRPALLPGPKGEKKTERRGVIQAVVRIHSLQSLQHVRRKTIAGKETLVDAQGRELPRQQEDAEKFALKHAKELVEYVVVQKTLRNSREGPWKLWGTAEEMTVEKLMQKERRATDKGRQEDAAVAS